MNTLGLIAVLSMSASVMYLTLDHHYYAQATIILLEKRMKEDYLIDGLLTYGCAMYAARGTSWILPYKIEVRYALVPEESRCLLLYEYEGEIVRITASIETKGQQPLAKEALI